MSLPKTVAMGAAVLILAATATMVTTRKRGEARSLPAGANLAAPRQVGDRQWRIPGRSKAEYFSTPQRINTDINLAPTMGTAPDTITELKIAKIAADSPLFAAGFRKDDRILKVNGEPVTTLSRAFNLSHEIQKSATVTVQVERGGCVLEYRFEFE